MRVCAVSSVVLLFAACGEHASYRSPDGRFRVVAAVEATDPAGHTNVARALAAAPADATIVVFAPASLPPSEQRGTRRTVLVGGDGTLPAGVAAAITGANGADAAVDLALLHCHGIEIPARIPLGAQVLTAANQAAGGARQTGPGDVVLQLLRMQHAALLSGEPTTDVVFRLGFVQMRDDARFTSTRDAVVAAAQRQKRLVVSSKIADGSDANVDALVAALVDEGCRAIVLASDGPLALPNATAKAVAQKVALLALDPTLSTPASCVLGCEPAQLGRAAAAALQQLAPAGCALVELHGEASAPPTAAARHAVHDALQLQPN